MKVIMVFCTLISLFFCPFTLPSAQAQDLVFGIYTSDKPTVMYQKFKPIVEYLQNYLKGKSFPVTVRIRIYPTYEGAIEAMVQGQVDFARFGPASYILAHGRNNGIRLLCMEQKKGAIRFKGVFITKNHDTSPATLHELAGKSFAFGDRNSTIGRYLSQAELVKSGIHAGDLKRLEYLGRHDKVALAVAAGRYDAGVVKENTFYKYEKSKNLKQIAAFTNVTKPWVVRADFDESLYSLLREAMLSLDDKAILKNLKQDGFVAATDEEYDFVRKGMKVSEEF